MAPEHIAQGSVLAYRVVPASSDRPYARLASRTRLVSACPVTSDSVTTRVLGLEQHLAGGTGQQRTERMVTGIPGRRSEGHGPAE